MHKTLALLALIAQHSCLEQPAPEIKVDCKMPADPTPEQVLLCREAYEEVDRAFEMCCLQRRKSNFFDDCQRCVTRSPVEANATSEYELRTLNGFGRTKHNGHLIRINWG